MAKHRFFFPLLALVVVAIWGVTFVSTTTLIGAGMHPAAIFVIRNGSSCSWALPAGLSIS